MSHNKLEIYFFFALLIGILWISFSILAPFIFALILAGVFAVVFQGVYKNFSKLGNKSVAAMLTVIIVLITILAPLIFFGIQVFDEAQQMYYYVVNSGGRPDIIASIENYIHRVQDYFALDEVQPNYFSVNLGLYAKSGLNWLLQNLGAVFSSFAHIALNIFVFLYSLYYLLKDGAGMRKKLITLSPLTDKYDEQISSRMGLAINSVIRGTLVIAIIQGFMTGLGLLIFGVPNPAFWGSFAAISSLVPGVGTALVSIPAVIYLLATGNQIAAMGMAIWAVTVVGLVDNLLYPKLVERKMKIHSFFILLFVLGGIVFFGPMGFILGPVILSLLAALLDVYSFLIKEGAYKKMVDAT